MLTHNSLTAVGKEFALDTAYQSGEPTLSSSDAFMREFELGRGKQAASAPLKRFTMSFAEECVKDKADKRSGWRAWSTAHTINELRPQSGWGSRPSASSRTVLQDIDLSHHYGIEVKRVCSRCHLPQSRFTEHLQQTNHLRGHVIKEENTPR
jgi:hypothetical protein